MGGAQAGEVASALAAAALRERSDREAGGEADVVELVQEANRRVHQRALDDASASGMGTTMTVALVGEDGTVTIGHVGDSRAYMLRDGALEQLTDDHSLVAELVRRGELSQEEAEVHPQRSVITRALGTDPDVDVDAFTVAAQRGRRVPALLGRPHDDGGRRRDRRDRAAQPPRPAPGDPRTDPAANDHGGDDNVTAVLFEIADGARRRHGRAHPRHRRPGRSTPTTRTRSTPRTASRRRWRPTAEAPPATSARSSAATEAEPRGRSRARTTR